jgi:hypothetical protein
MTLEEIVRDIHAIEEDLQTYERKYGVLSETFYASFSAGEEPADDSWVLDWSDWAGAYELWLRRHEQYRGLMGRLAEQTDLANVIRRAARRERISVPA